MTLQDENLTSQYTAKRVIIITNAHSSGLVTITSAYFWPLGLEKYFSQHILKILGFPRRFLGTFNHSVFFRDKAA